jgi:hypothetical protein
MFPQLALIANAALREAVIATWEELWAMSRWQDMRDVPTSLEIAYPTLPHNQAVLSMALAVADAFETHHGIRVDRDRLIAGAVLQDASKIVEFERQADGALRRTARGEAYPHAFWAAHVALRHGVPDDVVHIILTHTPQASTFPTSIEGKILYHVDQIDVIGIHGDRWRKQVSIMK